MTVTGDRRAFLAPLRARLAGGIRANPAHPAPEPDAAVPAIRYRTVTADLQATFDEQARLAGASVHRTSEDDVPVDLLSALTARHGIRRAVASAEPEAQAVARALGGLGVDVLAGVPSAGAAAAADLGVTSAIALVAATGSVVLDSSVARSRVVGLLPRVHLCVAPSRRLVPSLSEVLRPLAGAPERVPSNLVVVTGPSRTGDIEQILTVGVHGPTAVEIVVTGA